MITPFEHDGKKFSNPKEAAEFFEKKGPKSDKIVNSEELAIKKDYVKSHDDFVKYMNQFTLALTKLKMKSAFPKTIMITHSVQAIDEIDKIVNTLYERLDEIYSLYFPKAAKSAKSIQDFVETVLEKQKKQDTMGIKTDDESMKLIKVFAEKIAALLSLRDELSNFVEKAMEEQCKNLSELCGNMLGARLLSLAGSLKKLARMPSSTIQVLGAEKALFRHLRSGAKPPKHGVILQHPLVSGAKNRGRAARKLASKIAIAAKMDFYGEKEIGNELRKDLESELK